MKTFTITLGRLFALVTLLLVNTNLFAQGFRVYTKDGQHQEYAAENVDSIVFFTKPTDEPTDEPSDDYQSSGTLNGHNYVDLGLSVKWADRNVGASSPSDYGSYFAWGETSTKSDYSHTNCVTDGKYLSDISGDSRYDAARANWGGSWRLPTTPECEELVDKCTWTWTTQGGHNGYEVTGPNGNSIFLPAAGLREGTSLSSAGETGDYWSSTPGRNAPSYAERLTFNIITHYRDWRPRFGGLSVRPVSD